jgi:NAD(P)-dependent dehydrogenase (short-subunit alcohol dehydrogenase family)
MSTPREYEGQTAVITGAARGIGFGIARRLAEEGARVLIADINAEGGHAAVQTLRNIGLKADSLHADLSAPGGAAAMIAAAAQLAGSVDVLVNNARAGRRLGLLEESEENWNLTLDVGLKAAFFASQATIKLMAEHNGCRIVNIASVAATQVTNESPSYHASKAGLLQLTKYLAVAGGPHRARANAILPGLIVQQDHRPRFDAPDNATYRALTARYQPLGDVGTERDVAEAVLYLCSHRARYVSGSCLVLDGAGTAQEPFGLLLRQLDSLSGLPTP